MVQLDTKLNNYFFRPAATDAQFDLKETTLNVSSKIFISGQHPQVQNRGSSACE